MLGHQGRDGRVSWILTTCVMDRYMLSFHNIWDKGRGLETISPRSGRWCNLLVCKSNIIIASCGEKLHK